MTEMNTDEIRARAENEPLVKACERRVGWAREVLVSADWTDSEKVWVRRYEIDVPALLDANAALGAYLVPALESEALAIDNFYAATDRAEAAEAEVRVLQSALEDSPTGLAQRALAAEAEVVALRAALERIAAVKHEGSSGDAKWMQEQARAALAREEQW